MHNVLSDKESSDSGYYALVLTELTELTYNQRSRTTQSHCILIFLSAQFQIYS